MMSLRRRFPVDLVAAEATAKNTRGRDKRSHATALGGHVLTWSRPGRAVYSRSQSLRQLCSLNGTVLLCRRRRRLWMPPSPPPPPRRGPSVHSRRLVRMRVSR